MATDHFYSSLPVLTDLIEITNPKNFVPVPEDWLIIITDIVRSSIAIELGRYKDVNLVGASSIIALLNLARDIEIPFVFGGDGAAILIPPELLPKAKQALLATQATAFEEFSLTLRVGIVPISTVIADGYDVKIAKLKASANYSQSVFIGGGLSHATDLIKSHRTSYLYSLKRDKLLSKADFSGLECRWRDIPSQHGEVVSLLVFVTAKKSEAAYLYREIIEQIRVIYGGDDRMHPVNSQSLQLSFSRKNLLRETKIRASGSKLSKFFYLLKIEVENLLGWLFMTFGLTVGGLNWGNYRETVLAATDYRKFDDMLRMVISGNTNQRQKLTSYLEKKLLEGKLVFGLHVSDRAIMTCLVLERDGQHVHFIDGADGGYAMAARMMKKQINTLNLETKVS